MRTAALIVIASLAVAGSASANCDGEPGYWFEIVSGNATVGLGPMDWGRDNCEDAGPLLRENTETNEVVSLEWGCEFVEDGTFTLHYPDECVPAGEYRYGLEEPLTCGCGMCSPPDYYIEVTVEAGEENPDCELSEGNPGPSSYSGAVPWAGVDEPRIDCDVGCGGEDGEGDDGDRASDCSVAGAGRGTEPLLAFLMLAVGAGALLLSRKKTTVRQLPPDGGAGE